MYYYFNKAPICFEGDILINPRSNTSCVRSYISIRGIDFNLIHEERQFLRWITALFLIAGAVYPNPGIVMWIGFILAGYLAITNDLQVIYEEIIK